MLSLNEIQKAQTEFGRQETLSQFLKALRELGVQHYDMFVEDGHSEYYTLGDEKLVGPAVHDKQTLSNTIDKLGMLACLSLREQGVTDYMEMVTTLAKCGIEKWTFNTEAMTIAFYAIDGTEMLKNKIK